MSDNNLYEIWYGKQINFNFLDKLLSEIKDRTIRNNLNAWTHGNKERNSNFSDEWFLNLYSMYSDNLSNGVKKYLDDKLIPDKIFMDNVCCWMIDLICFLLNWIYLHNLSWESNNDSN